MGPVAGAEVAQQGRGGDRILAARAGADPDLVGGVIEKQVHAKDTINTRPRGKSRSRLGYYS
jgi:hypothetical protein